jgi:hypothetical protein
VGGKISKVTQRVVDVNRDVVRSAMEAFVAQEALAAANLRSCGPDPLPGGLRLVPLKSI